MEETQNTVGGRVRFLIKDIPPLRLDNFCSDHTSHYWGRSVGLANDYEGMCELLPNLPACAITDLVNMIIPLELNASMALIGPVPNTNREGAVGTEGESPADSDQTVELVFQDQGASKTYVIESQDPDIPAMAQLKMARKLYDKGDKSAAYHMVCPMMDVAPAGAVPELLKGAIEVDPCYTQGRPNGDFEFVYPKR